MKKSDLTAALEKFRRVPLLVVGDLIVDHYVWGRVSRISPEAPVVVVEVKSEDRRPGGAGNVARNLISLGAQVSVCGVVGDDDAGRQMTSMLQELGADISGVLVDRTRPTTIKSRVIAHAQQVVRIDRETTSQLQASHAEGVAATVGEKLNSVKGVVVSDYGKGVVCPQIFQRLGKARESGAVGLHKIPILVDPKLSGFPLYNNATVIKPNRKEASEASGMQIKDRASAIEVGKVLLSRWGCEVVMITLGEDGMVLVTNAAGEEPVVEIPTVAREVYDVSGAGDTVSAVFTLALAVGASPRVAAELANFAAGIVVAEIGTAAVSVDELRKAID